jgi:hypothetical protein
MSLRFKLIMFSTSDIRGFSCKSAEINRRYSARHGYDFTHEQYDSVALAPQYEKIRILRKHLGSTDYLVWLDSDACVIDQSLPLQTFCEEPKNLVIAGHEFGFDLAGRRVRYELDGHPCGLNTGVLLLRDTSWSEQFLEAWWSRCLSGAPAHTAKHEQGHLQQMLMENVLNLQAHTRIVTPCCRLNRCDDNGTDVCEFVLHLWGLQPKRREEIFSLIIEGKKPDIGIEMPRFNVASE